VSGAPAFFKRAFGDSYQEFESILLRPHRFIFNRDWYEHLSGVSEFEQFTNQFRRLNPSDKAELVALLSSVEPKDIDQLPERASKRQLRRILPFYRPISKEEEARIWQLQKSLDLSTIPEDERVEDAGLSDISEDDFLEDAVPRRAEVLIA
jgi:hypothetical protein